MKAISALVVLLVACAEAPQAPEPKLWTPEEISTEEYESSPAFTPDGSELFFMRADQRFRNYRLLWSRCTPSGWSTPVPPPFAAAAPVQEGDPFVTPDGRRIYFISSRYAFGASGINDDFDIWYAERKADGSWSGQAERLPAPVNTTASELLPRVTRDGALYFGSSRPGGLGDTDIYEGRRNEGGEWSVANLGGPVNSAHSEYEAAVSLDGQTLVVVADRGDRSHLYLFSRSGTRAPWVERSRLQGLPSVFQVGPLLSPNADRVLFAQAFGDRSGEMFLLDLAPNLEPGWPPACPRR